MKAKDIRRLLEPIGCWPVPTCHGCGESISANDEIAFSGVRTRDTKGRKLLAVVHAACVDLMPKEPDARFLKVQAAHDGRPSGGAYLTTEEGAEIA